VRVPGRDGEEALAMIADAIALLKEMYRENGWPLDGE